MMCMRRALDTHSRYDMSMRTNIVIDDALMSEAMRLAGIDTKRAVVQAALEHFVDGYRQRDLLRLKGTGWVDQPSDDRHRRW